MWNEREEWQRQMWFLAGRLPQRIMIVIGDSILQHISKSDALEAWITIHIMINYSFLYRLNDGKSLWKDMTDYCFPFALFILIIHFYSLIKYKPPGCAIYMRILLTTVICQTNFDILPNIVMAFLLQTKVANGNRRLFNKVSNFICSHNDDNSKQSKIICCHYYLIKLYDVTKELYRNNYLHLYAHRRIPCNFYQNNFIEKLRPKIEREIEHNLTSKINENLDLSSIRISNWTYLWHIILGYDKFWIQNFYQKKWFFILFRFIYIMLLIFGILQYLAKLHCFINVLKDFETNSWDKDWRIIFILFGEFWTFGFLTWYVRKKDSDRFIVRLYQQQFVEIAFRFCHIAPKYINNKTLNDIKLFTIYYNQKRYIFHILYNKFGKDIGILILQFIMPYKWKLSIKLTRRSYPDRIKTNIEEYNIFNGQIPNEQPIIHSSSWQHFDYGC